MSQEYTIRPLKKSDQKRVAAIFGKLADTDNNEYIKDIISASSRSAKALPADKEQATADIVTAFLKLIKESIKRFSDDVESWFADLLGVTVEQYQDMPFDIDIRVLEQIKGQPDVENFFTGAFRLFSATQWLKNIYAEVKEKFDTVIGSQKKRLTPSTSRSSTSGPK